MDLLLDFVGVVWYFEVVVLGDWVVYVVQQSERGCVFDIFGDADDFQVLGEIDDAAHDDLVFLVGVEILDERTVDLDGVDGKVVQVGERVVVGVEVVDGDVQFELLQVVEDDFGVDWVVCDGVLGDLELDVVGWQVVRGEDFGDYFGEVVLYEVVG